MATIPQKPYLPADLVSVTPDPVTDPFWEGCRLRELRLQRCGDCKRFRHPPLPGCPQCGSGRSEWVKVSGKGTVFSYTIAYHAVSPQVAKDVPYNVVLVEMEGAPGVRLVSNLVDTPPEQVRVGLPVEVAWEQAGTDMSLPRFRRA